MTIPTLLSNIEKTQLRTSFKKMYSLLNQAVMSIQTENGMPIKCFYWVPEDKPCKEVCSGKNEFGTCISYTCADGSPLPPDTNGLMSECSAFYNELFYSRLKTQKICETKALDNGCLTNDYRGFDIIRKEQSSDPNYKPDPNVYFSDSQIKNNYPVVILADGSLIIKYASLNNKFPLFLIDTNGHRGPNKYGYDIFVFTLKGNSKDGIKILAGESYVIEKGGVSFDSMVKSIGLK